MAFDKTRFRFRKDGDLRLVSHHDLMRALERMLRRSGLPFRSTEGFHPQPRVVFAQSLSLGIAGLNEVVEIEWLEAVDPLDALSRLTQQAPIGLTFLSANRIDLRQAAKPRRAVYRMRLSPATLADTAARCATVMRDNELWVERERPRPRLLNVRPYIDSLWCDDASLSMAIWITPEGSARADELIKALDLNHELDAGAVIERAVLDIEDEQTPEQAAPLRPKLPGRDDRAMLERPLLRAPAKHPVTLAAASAHWGASPNGPIVE